MSRETRYALAALSELARSSAGKLVKAREVAAATELPGASLAKVLQALARARVIGSVRGGGYRLDRAPDTIGLSEIIAAVNGWSVGRQECVFWRKECSEVRPCMLHWLWRDLGPQIEAHLGVTTLAEVIDSGWTPRGYPEGSVLNPATSSA